MQEWIINIMNQFGYLGIALLIAIENIFPPIPSELILTFGGFMTTYTSMNIWLVVLFATIGSVIGAIILYGVGRLLSPEKLEWVVGKWGHILGLKKEDVKRAESWFIRSSNSSNPSPGKCGNRISAISGVVIAITGLSGAKSLRSAS